MLGGVNRAAESSISRGVPGLSKIPSAGRLFANRATGREASASTTSAHVWIHNLDELDAATLAAARRDASPAEALDAQIARKAEFLSRNVSRTPTTTASTPPPEVARGASAPEKTSRSPQAPRWGTYDPRR